MAKILGLDLGTNSIGIALRNTDKGDNLTEQLELFNSVIFNSGVGIGKTGEFSYAAERTKKRSARRLYQARKYRIWATLELLIKEGYCPLSLEDLDKWRRYDKEKGLKRQYPIHAIEFEQWVRLDFNGDGVADYSSPYQLRAELMQKQFDFTNQTDRYKLGRALYHIAQHRGFKSSKGETIKEQSQEDSNKEFDVTELKKSEEKKSGELVEYMTNNNLPTVGCAFAKLEAKGERIKASKYQAVRSQYKKEIEAIFEFQNGLDISSDFYKRITSEKKGEGTIFYKRPLRSQKGNIGKCTLEPNKSRCPISHPEFEEYRAWCFINNIKYREDTDSEWQILSLELKEKLFVDKFLKVKTSFQFKEIREWLQKELNLNLICEEKIKTINYKDKTSISACPISARLKNLLGEDYKEWKLETSKNRINPKTGEIHNISYNYIDIWHICFSFDEVENIVEFATNTLQFDDKQTKQLATIWGNIQQGYSTLSLKAIRNINQFLKQGFIYSDAVLLAKLPDLFKDKWEIEKDIIISELSTIIEQNRLTKEIYNITNTLISNYKSLDFEERFAEHNTQYKLQDQDYLEIEKILQEHYTTKQWESKSISEQEYIKSEVIKNYQTFFTTTTRDYYKIPKLSESLAEYLFEKYDFLTQEDLKKIYHPSMIDIYPASKETFLEDGRYLKLLGSPVIGALKNPMAMRVLHTLRSQINDLIKEGKIDEHTRIVVETARELNDANMRWAIAEYQREKEKQNKEIEKKLEEHGIKVTEDTIRKYRIWSEQSDIIDENDTIELKSKTQSLKEKDNIFKLKYQLWQEQGFRCIYTGDFIKIADLFDEDKVDIEHTIPRSISFDDSLSNLTVCYSYYNRKIKKNLYPTQLPEYKEKILPRIQPWIEKVKHLENMVLYWKEQSKKSQDKERKDRCIRQGHLWKMEYEYWKKKVDYFTTKEISSTYRNNQLNDTRIITKYAYHYLKTVFNKVEVQKGEVTSVFRKVIGIESIYDKKDRSKHSHHAIDATILTLIPTAKKRDELLLLHYQGEENKENKTAYQEKICKELNKFIPKDTIGIRGFIESNILVNHVSKDQALVHAKRRKRIRGRIVPMLDENGKIVFERNEDGTIKKDKFGRPIPQAKQWIKGDCIRGQLHGETFYGAITQKETDEVIYVVRRELKHKANAQDSGFKNWEELEKVIVDKDLFEIIRSQFPEGTDFKTAVAKGIYMLNNKKEKVNKIRHVRCIVPSVKNPLKIKEQTYKSKKEYKNNYHATVGDLCAMSKYESVDKKKSKYIVWNLFDIITNRKTMNEDIPLIQSNLNLVYTLVKGDILLIYDKNPKELYGMDRNQLQQRLYVISRFEGDGRIQLLKTINAEKEPKTESIKDFYKLPEKIRQSINGLNYLIKGRDFDLINGEIVFFNKNK
ncbi:MAG: HNH endonuclease domain-containing protein [Bacteroidales bacterium]|nr:HNH endonuclease domain-containing protein [Bacteroidales bacterium]